MNIKHLALIGLLALGAGFAPAHGQTQPQDGAAPAKTRADVRAEAVRNPPASGNPAPQLEQDGAAPTRTRAKAKDKAAAASAPVSKPKQTRGEVRQQLRQSVKEGYRVPSGDKN